MAIKNQEIRLINFMKNTQSNPSYGQTETGATFAYYQATYFCGYKWATDSWREYYKNQHWRNSEDVSNIAKEWTWERNHPLLIDGEESAELTIYASSRKVIKSILYHHLGKIINTEDIEEAPSGGVFRYSISYKEHRYNSEAENNYNRQKMAEIIGLKFKPARPEFLLYAELAD